MCTINLQDIMQNKNYPDSGDILFQFMKQHKDADKIVINLNGVISLPSIFLNVSIGRFIDEFGVDLLRKKVAFAQISTSQAERIKDYIAKVSTK